jgi:Fe-S cluster assembly protein SufD
MNAVAAIPQSLLTYADAFGKLDAALPGGAGWRARRRASLDRLLRLGLPTQRDEAWKYAPLRLIEQSSFEPQRGDQPVNAAAAREIESSALTVAGARRLTFVEGRFQPAVSDEPATIDDLDLRMLADALHLEPGALLAGIPELGERAEDRFALLNETFLSEGVVLRVREGSAPAPLHLQFIADAPGRSRHPRVVIEVAAGAHAQVIEQHQSRSAGHALANGVTNIRLHPGATLEHYLLLDPAAPAGIHSAESRPPAGAGLILHGTYVSQAAGSRLVHHRVLLGGEFTRASLQVRLEERDASVELNTLTIAPAREYADAHSIIEHCRPATKSVERFRATAGKGGHAVFNGRVVVHPGAARSDSHQSSRGLLLEPGAEIDSRPQLEIYNDDVKCAHGATTGRLDEDMLFYLLSRGLDPATARGLLVFAFLDDVVARMGLDAVRRHLERRIAAALPDGPVIREFL